MVPPSARTYPQFDITQQENGDWLTDHEKATLSAREKATLRQRRRRHSDRLQARNAGTAPAQPRAGGGPSTDVAEQVSREILDELAKETSAKGLPAEKIVDPSTVINLAIMVLELIQQCRQARTPQALHEMCSSPSIVHRLLLRRGIISHMGHDFFAQHGKDAAAIIFDQGARADNATWSALLQQVQQLPAQ